MRSQKRLDLTTQAAQADAQGDYQRALKLYTLGVEAFMGVLRLQENATIVNTLRPKVAEYMRRAEQLQVMIAKQQQLDTPLDDEVSLAAFPAAPKVIADNKPVALHAGASASAAPRPTPPKVVGDELSTVASSSTSAARTLSGGGGALTIHIAEGERGWTFERLLAPAVDADSTRSVKVSDIRLLNRSSVVNFVRLCEALCKLLRPRADRPLRLELSTNFDLCDESTRRATITSLLDVAKSLEREHVDFALTRADAAAPPQIASESHVIALDAARGLDLFHEPESELAVGAFDVALRACHANHITMRRR